MATALAAAGAFIAPAWTAGEDAGTPAVSAGEAAPPLLLTALDGGALAPGWSDVGWAPHTLIPGQAAKVDFSAFAGWILARSTLPADLGGLVVRFRAPASFGDFLDISLGSRAHASFPKVRAGPASRHDLPDGWTELWLRMEALNPLHLPFDQVTLRANRALPAVPVEIALIGFTAQPPAKIRERRTGRLPSRAATVTLDCGRTQPISPLIYGVAFGDPSLVRELGASARRWGGNTTSRYNWKLGNAWNTGQDWFFRNVAMGPDNPTWDRFLDQDRSSGRVTAFTLPMTGWVAKDTVSCAFPVSEFGEQMKVDPDTRRCGDGLGPGGTPLAPGPPTATSIAASPRFVGEWVSAIRGKSLPQTRLYYLDNEPTLWHVAHRDVHPERLSYDELLSRTIEYGTAVREADPQARIGGFVGWGWSALFYSAADRIERGSGVTVPSDRLLHAGKQLLPWWLSQLRAHQKRTGVRVVDLVDVHFYPQATGMGLYGDGWIDPESSARRIRSVRALWDPTYKDESWIAEPVRLIPRLREWIREENPDLGISIGEYNFGAEGHISGGLAVAEALGRFGLNGVEAAFYWSLPPRGSAAYWAFRAYRNYDGAQSRVGDVSVAASNSDRGLSSVFATRRAGGDLVIVVLNHEPEKTLEVTLDGGTCGPVQPARMFSYTGEGGLEAVQVPPAASRPGLPPSSINVVELRARATAK